MEDKPSSSRRSSSWEKQYRIFLILPRWVYISKLEYTEPRYVLEFSHFSLCSAGLRSRAFLENTKRRVLGCLWLRALGLSDQEILAHEFIV